MVEFNEKNMMGAKGDKLTSMIVKLFSTGSPKPFTTRLFWLR